MNIASPELTEVGTRLLTVAEEYWKAAHIDNVRGAVIWLEDSVGNTVIFTCGEYRRQLMDNIDRLPDSVIKTFEHIVTDPEFEE